MNRFPRISSALARWKQLPLSRRILMGLAVLVLLSPLLHRPALGRAAAECTVRTLTLERTLFEHGILDPLDSIPLEVAASGEIVSISPSGTRIKKGDVIVRVSDTDLRDGLQDMQSDLESLELTREINEAEYRLLELQEKNRLRTLEKQLELAVLEETTVRAGLTTNEVRLLEIDKTLARLRLEEDAEELARQERLLQKGFISAPMLESYQRRVETAREALKQVETEIRLKQAGADPEQLLELRQRCQQTRAQLARGTKAMQRALELSQAQIDIANIRIARKNAAIGRLEEEIRSTEVVAPIDGIMSVRLYRDWRSGGGMTEYKPGIRQWKGDRIADIVNPGRMNVLLMIHESDVAHLQTNMPARIHVLAFPRGKFEGRLTELGGIGRDRHDVAPPGFDPDETGVTMFNASVAFEGGGVEFRPGMSALVEIVVEPAAPRLVVPRGAVRRDGDGYSVLQKSLFGTRRVPVRGRPFDARYFAVEGGLDEGDTVLISQDDNPT